MDAHVTKHPEQDRYVLTVDGQERGELTYLTSDTTIELPHTFVDPALRGTGLGVRLVREALEDIRDTTDLRVIPTCPFIATWLLKNPEYRDLTRR
ncbi:MAG TPA: N-acetyltransferase [Pseudoclavibacter sp.]|nr:N-acetyltransferase [Pseudoclavibacter sp.]